MLHPALVPKKLLIRHADARIGRDASLWLTQAISQPPGIIDDSFQRDRTVRRQRVADDLHVLPKDLRWHPFRRSARDVNSNNDLEPLPPFGDMYFDCVGHKVSVACKLVTCCGGANQQMRASCGHIGEHPALIV